MACCAIAIHLLGRLCDGIGRVAHLAGITFPRRPAVYPAAAWRLADVDPA